ncbi:LytR/AlgR family response regulator transcription factor [Sphingomonas soli]|uniref:LytR/AlgR family response regulator transcription factor n=1 Tax=Sphingomonas soli TaxID=266127 RepID=UPI0008317619|nr:LytTR family DNA-binding domain-containing protein [Sphingomonas soli]
MKVVIADDEPLARELLRALLLELPGVEVMGEAEDVASAITVVREHRPDLVILDIDMPHRNGIQAAIELAGDGVEVIFVTAHEEHAIDAFEIGAIDYVLKPVRRPRLAKAMERARLRHRARAEPPSPQPPQTPVPVADAFWVPVMGGTARVPIADIVRVEAAGDHVYLHTAERAYLYRSTMADLEKRLHRTGLIRIHRSAFVRIERVTGTIRRGKVLVLSLADGGDVVVGPNYRTAALEAIATG